MFKNSYNYDEEFIKSNMMGPNSMRIISELAESLKLEKGMRVLDLGCGKGLTSIYLAKEYGVTVYATDLWISASDNFGRIKAMHLEDKIIPIHADAYNLPYSKEYFDVAVSVDAYHYFGCTKDYLTNYLAPLVKNDGQIAVAIPGIKKEFTNGIPEELNPYLTEDMNFHSCEWWYNLWSKSELVSIEDCTEMNCLKDAWNDWLSTDNIYAKEDIKMLNAEGGNYFNLVSIIARKL